MPIDAYDPCPCGSGKKFKFCCSAATDEIDKVLKYQEKHQTQSAMQVLDRMMASKHAVPWGYVTKSRILLNEGEYAESRKTLVPLLEKTPDHAFAIALYATAAFASMGYESAKPAIYRAFQRCSPAFPDVVGSLSGAIASWMFDHGHYLGSRQHLAQAMRLVPNEDKQALFVKLLEFDGNRELPYPLRSVHPLIPYRVPESAEPGQQGERQKLLHRAESLVAIGCFEPAAEAYRNLAEGDPEHAGLWQNAGLCAAWDGNEVLAAEGLHRAAKLHADPEAAVECETLAQLMDRSRPDAQAPMLRVAYKTNSVSRLLSLLDEHPRFDRLPELPQNDEDSRPNLVTFRILDRPPLPEDPTLWPELDAIPLVIGQVNLVLQVQEDQPQALLSGPENDALCAAREELENFASEVLEVFNGDLGSAGFSSPYEEVPMLFEWNLPEKMPAVRQMQLEQRRWEQNVKDIWPNTPLSGLGGKTPNEAKGDSTLEIPLRAAIHVLDAFCDRHEYQIDLEAVCRDFGVAPPTPIETQPDLPQQSYSAMQLQRLKIKELSDEQLVYVLNRVLLIHHGRVLHEALLEGLSRANFTEKLELQRIYGTLLELAQERNDRDETYRWIQAGRSHAQTLDQAFEKTLAWDVRELSFRVEDPGDPNLLPLVSALVRKYAKKVPQFFDYVTDLLMAYGIDFPDNLVEIARESAAFSQGGIWTPDEQSEEAGSKKLWLPGQS